MCSRVIFFTHLQIEVIISRMNAIKCCAHQQHIAIASEKRESKKEIKRGEQNHFVFWFIKNGNTEFLILLPYA